jgi:anti-anti-sigma factor
MAPPLATADLLEKGPIHVICVRGELDLDNARQFGDQLLASLPADAAGLVLELGEVRFLDSAGVRLLVELAERLKRNRQALALAVPDGSAILPVLELVKIDLIVPVYKNTPAAKQSLLRLAD